MARYHATIHTGRSPEDVFTYLSDFSTAAEWDPGVIEAERLGGAELGVGAAFRLVAEFLGRRSALTYRIVEYDPPHAVAFLGENTAVTSLDRITFAAVVGGTRVTYDADLRLKGPLRIADPLLKLAFNRVGDRARAGLRRTLAPPVDRVLRPLSGRSLDGRHVALPADLGTPHTVLIMAFRRGQQDLVDGWLPWLGELEQRRPDVAVYEVPVLSSAYGPMRWFIDGGMARGVPDPAARARTVTVYTDVETVLDNLGLDGTDTILVALVEADGRIVARETGGFDPDKAERLLGALPAAPVAAGR